MNYGKNGIPYRGSEGSRLKAVICGSFRRDPSALESEFHQLKEAGCAVLSPHDLHFVTEEKGFVYGRRDLGLTSGEIEQAHLRAMQTADFVWLHCPNGYVGTSAAMELGFAGALGLRVFAAEQPDDVTLAGLVQACDSPSAAVTSVTRGLGEAPSGALLALQRYYSRAAEERDWSEETADLTLKLLREEVDELEAALGPRSNEDEAALELADVQLYIVHLANILGVDLASAVCEKERINAARFGPSIDHLAV